MQNVQLDEGDKADNTAAQVKIDFNNLNHIV